jgi:3-isopropylmalate dehydratase small subunit
LTAIVAGRDCRTRRRDLRQPTQEINIDLERRALKKSQLCVMIDPISRNQLLKLDDIDVTDSYRANRGFRRDRRSDLEPITE